MSISISSLLIALVLVLGLAAVVALIVGIAAYPKDNSF